MKRRSAVSPTVEVLAIGAHPDDVELGCGATLALLSRAGRRIGIAHLTRGERGTRGTQEQRRREAERAAEKLGAVALDFLDCGDGGLRTGAKEEDSLIALLRRRRPDLVFAPPPRDRHPDHARAHTLVHAACFYAGLRRRAVPGAGPPHRPAVVFSYMQHDGFTPSFIVDVTAAWPRKLAALACYESQLHQPERSPTVRREPATKIASPEFFLAVEGRARHFGQMIDAEFGEPFWSRTPLWIDDPWMLRPNEKTR